MALPSSQDMDCEDICNFTDCMIESQSNFDVVKVITFGLNHYYH